MVLGAVTGSLSLRKMVAMPGLEPGTLALVVDAAIHTALAGVF